MSAIEIGKSNAAIAVDQIECYDSLKSAFLAYLQNVRDTAKANGVDDDAAIGAYCEHFRRLTGKVF